VGVASSARAEDYPKLKPGLWELQTRTHSDRAKGGRDRTMSSTVCMDEAMQKNFAQLGASMKQSGTCTRQEIHSVGRTWVGDAECKLGQGNTVFKSHSVTTVQGDGSYKTEIATTYDPPFMGMSKSNTTVQGKYAGACKPGMRPGDVTVNGRTVNMRGNGTSAGVPPPPPK
jgi:hypothetical protein